MRKRKRQYIKTKDSEQEMAKRIKINVKNIETRKRKKPYIKTKDREQK